MKYRIFIIFFFIPLVSFSQKLDTCGTLKRLPSGMMEFINDVRFSEGKTLIYCDHALFDNKDKKIIATKNVHVVHETADIYGDNLIYNGKIKQGQFRNNVILIEEGKTLTTDFLDFSTKDNSGTFYNGGEMVDSSGTLTSIRGFYQPRKKKYTFVDSVVVKNENYDLYTDSLIYDMFDNKAYYYGPTTIISDSTTIYCEKGWFDNRNKIAQFTENVYIHGKEQKILGDTVFYNQNTGIGRAKGNIELHDTVENVTITGNKAIFNEEPEYAQITEKAVFIQVHEGDSLYMHADTLYTEYDTTGVYRIVKAFHHSTMYRHDLQAKSDSIVYSFEDSIINLYINPILWTDNNQITAKEIKIHTKYNKPDYIDLLNSSFIAQQENEEFYNQIKGQNMKVYFKQGDLDMVDVINNSLAIYFPKDGDDFIGINKSESTNMRVFIKNRRPTNISFSGNPSAIMYPLEDLSGDEIILDGFKWLDKLRPASKEDIFIWKDIMEPKKEEKIKKDKKKRTKNKQ